jgi:hypothetical protein
VTIHIVDIHQVTHTCPAHPDPHPYDTRRTIVHTIPGGPCRTPVTIRCGHTTTTVPCGRQEPAKRQCPPCATVVTEHTITTRHLTNEMPT